MARTTAADIQAVMDVDDTLTLTPFITTANLLVTKHCADENSAYTATELLQIETFLAAHIITLRDPRVKSESVGKISMDYESNTGLLLDSSKYGQMAKILDWYGGLAALEAKMKAGGRRTVGIDWLGEESETLEE